MTDESLLQCIIDDPDDDAPRLIYADWLDEHGQTDRAEFIRVQCELAGKPGKKDLESRQRELLQPNRDSWAHPLLQLAPGMISTFGFHRGFIEEIAVEGRGLQASARELFSLTPIRRLTVYLVRSRIVQISALPQLERLTGLNLELNELGDESVRVLADSPYLNVLTSLGLRRNGIGDVGVDYIARSRNLVRLKELDLTGNEIRDVGAIALATHMNHLQDLQLYWDPIGNAGRKALFEAFGSRVRLNEKPVT